MVPVLDMRHYTKFVLEYLSAILDKHKSTVKTLTGDLFIQIFDVLNSPKINYSKDVTKIIQDQKILIKVRALYYYKLYIFIQ